MKIPHEILITGLVLLPQKPAGVLLWTSVTAWASLFKKAGSLMPRCSKEQHSLQRNICGLLSKYIKYVLYLPQINLPQTQGNTVSLGASWPVTKLTCPSTEVLCESCARIPTFLILK